jgi:hypothetical protein
MRSRKIMGEVHGLWHVCYKNVANFHQTMWADCPSNEIMAGNFWHSFEYNISVVIGVFLNENLKVTQRTGPVLKRRREIENCERDLVHTKPLFFCLSC